MSLIEPLALRSEVVAYSYWIWHDVFYTNTMTFVNLITFVTLMFNTLASLSITVWFYLHRTSVSELLAWLQSQFFLSDFLTNHWWGWFTARCFNCQMKNKLINVITQEAAEFIAFMFLCKSFMMKGGKNQKDSNLWRRKLLRDLLIQLGGQ